MMHKTKRSNKSKKGDFSGPLHYADGKIWLCRGQLAVGVSLYSCSDWLQPPPPVPSSSNPGNLVYSESFSSIRGGENPSFNRENWLFTQKFISLGLYTQSPSARFVVVKIQVLIFVGRLYLYVRFLIYIHLTSVGQYLKKVMHVGPYKGVCT
jgi:hypothetical protein